MAGSFIEVVAQDGGRFNAYIARPAQGSGPGLVLLQEIFGINDYLKSMADRYAEEGYVVLVPDLFWRIQPGTALGYGDADMAQAFDYLKRFDIDLAVNDIAATIATLRALPGQAGNVGTIGYCLGGKLAMLAAARTDVDCAVSYYGVGLEDYLDEVPAIRCPMAFHFAEKDAYCPPDVRARITAALSTRPQIEHYVYAGYAHRMRLATKQLKNSKPADTKLIPISRTIGADRIVDEFIFSCTHSREIVWMLPGVAPTGKYFEVPMLPVVCFRGDMLYNEHN